MSAGSPDGPVIDSAIVSCPNRSVDLPAADQDGSRSPRHDGENHLASDLQMDLSSDYSSEWLNGTVSGSGLPSPIQAATQ